MVSQPIPDYDHGAFTREGKLMNPTDARPPAFPWPTTDCDRNRDRLPATERARWQGRHVAWSWDGTHIVAGADTLSALLAELQRHHVDPATVVFDFLDAPL